MSNMGDPPRGPGLPDPGGRQDAQRQVGVHTQSDRALPSTLPGTPSDSSGSGDELLLTTREVRRPCIGGASTLT